MSETYDLVVRGGEVALPGGLITADVAVRDGRFATIGDIPDGPWKAVDAKDCHVLPGIIDAHVHLGVEIAGQQSRDTSFSGTMAAVCGGVTTVGDFTVQAPREGLMESVARRVKAAESGTSCDWFLHANLTSPSRAVLDEIPEVIASGITSFKLFLAYPGLRVDAKDFREVLSAVGAAEGLVMVHAEDQSHIDHAVDGLVADGRIGAREFFDSRPPDAESAAIRTAGSAAKELGIPVYVVHLSSKKGLAAAREIREMGGRLHLETCPQYLYLTRPQEASKEAAGLVCAPPLRERADCEALIAALRSGEIDVLATDHCPFSLAQKTDHQTDFRRIPGGLPGVETLLPLAYDLFLEGGVELDRMVQLLAASPARLFGLAHRKGAIREGLDADFVILDPAGTTRIAVSRLHSATDYSPYQGMSLKGALQAVYLRGRCAARLQDGGGLEPVGSPRGEFLRARF